MTASIRGIHHVTAIATDPRQNLDFYQRVLGLRLVKKTVNFDDPGTYHLYYGDETGRPGSVLTFFPWPLARRGSRGSGQATATAFIVPEGSLGWWKQRLEDEGIVSHESEQRLASENVLTFYDPDGLRLELVEQPVVAEAKPWAETVPVEHAIRGFHGVTLSVREVEPTAELLTRTMGLKATADDGRRFRFEAEDPIGGKVDLVHTPELGFGRIAAGTVHHVAWRVPDEADQLAWRERLEAVGLEATPILDRQYFKSIYFRERGGVLFEFATEGPGFARDESEHDLGTRLQLPPWLEGERERIEGALPALERDEALGSV